jgi:hypothetical protein
VQVLELQVDHRLHQAVVRLHVARAPVGPMVPVAADPAAIVRALVGQVDRVAADPAAMVTHPVARPHRETRRGAPSSGAEVSVRGLNQNGYGLGVPAKPGEKNLC